MLLDHPSVTRFDQVADDAFEKLRSNASANRVFYSLSEAANHSILWHSIAWKRALLFKNRRREAIEISIALGVESALVNGGVKRLFRRERPEAPDKRPHKLRTPLTSSFPSGHATSAFCAAILLSRRSKAAPLYFGLATLVSASRVHVKIHHASDVVGGAIIGTGLGIVARKILAALSD